MTLTLAATPEEVMRAVEAFQDFARARKVPEKIIFGMALALEECASNIVNHAMRRNGKFEVLMDASASELLLELRDCGPEFDPTQVVVRKAAEDDDLPGGWGIELVRRYTDDIQYRREGGHNIVRLVKRLDPRLPGVDLSIRTPTQ